MACNRVQGFVSDQCHIIPGAYIESFSPRSRGGGKAVCVHLSPADAHVGHRVMPSPHWLHTLAELLFMPLTACVPWHGSCGINSSRWPFSFTKDGAAEAHQTSIRLSTMLKHLAPVEGAQRPGPFHVIGLSPGALPDCDRELCQ